MCDCSESPQKKAQTAMYGAPSMEVERWRRVVRALDEHRPGWRGNGDIQVVGDMAAQAVRFMAREAREKTTEAKALQPKINIVMYPDSPAGVADRVRAATAELSAALEEAQKKGLNVSISTSQHQQAIYSSSLNQNIGFGTFVLSQLNRLAVTNITKTEVTKL